MTYFFFNNATLRPVFSSSRYLCLLLVSILNLVSDLAFAQSINSQPPDLPPSLGEMQVTPKYIPTNQEAWITATVTIKPEFKAETVLLQQLDSNAQNTVATLANFNDLGEKGDFKAGDGVYTARAKFNLKNPTDLFLGASGSFQNSKNNQISSLPVLIRAKANISMSGPWAVVENYQLTFRDSNGWDLPVVQPPFKESAPSFTQESAIVSPDQSHGATIGSLWVVLPPSIDKSLVGRQFRYQDATGTLWSKTLKDINREFFLSNSSVLISEDGGRVLLIDVGEDNNAPALSVYSAAGEVLLTEKLALYAIEEAQIASNGRYVLLKGLPKTPTADVIKLIVINVDNPLQRWQPSYHGAVVTSERIEENALGGFSIWLNGHKKFSFPQ